MESASPWVAAYSSDEDDYVSMDEDELNVGIQSANIIEPPKLKPAPVQQQQQIQQQKKGRFLVNFFKPKQNNAPIPPPLPAAAPLPDGARKSEKKKKDKKKRKKKLDDINEDNDDDNDDDSTEDSSEDDKIDKIKDNKKIELELGDNANDDDWGDFSADKEINEAAQQIATLKNFHKKNALKKDRKVLHKQKINTNVVSLDLGTLGNKANIATGDAFFCKNKQCGVMLSKFDELKKLKNENKKEKKNDKKNIKNEDKDEQKIIDDDNKKDNVDDNDNDDDDEYVWNCLFCGTKNIIDIVKEEMPNDGTMDYILSKEEQKMSDVNENENLIVFCIDISGSMCVTQEVAGKFNIKGKKSFKELNDEFSQFGDGSDQYFPNQNKNVTYISRLEAVKASIGDELENMIKNNPNNKVCLVTFASEVTIIGDGISKPVFIAGDKLNKEDLLKEIGTSYELSNKTIKDTSLNLQKKLYSLKEEGQTALGPALLISMSIASKKEGSQVILCTDGVANMGLGNLENLKKVGVDVLNKNEDDINENNNENNFYNITANWGLNKGITVNVISITDANCELEYLGKVCDITGGVVERINPLDLSKNFKGIFDNKILATKVIASMFLHPCLGIKNDDDDEQENNNENNAAKKDDKSKKVIKKDKNDDKKENDNNNDMNNIKISKTIKNVGNVFKDSKIYFEYTINKKLLKNDLKYKNLKQLPFQVQINYVKNGKNITRVITNLKEITKNRKNVLNNLNYDVIGSHISRKVGNYAEKGDYEQARMMTYSHGLWMSKNVKNKTQAKQFRNYMNDNSTFDQMLQTEQTEEIDQLTNNNYLNNNINVKNANERISSWSAFGFGNNNVDDGDNKIKFKKKAKKVYRASKRNDNLSKAMYKHKKK